MNPITISRFQNSPLNNVVVSCLLWKLKINEIFFFLQILFASHLTSFDICWAAARRELPAKITRFSCSLCKDCRNSSAWCENVTLVKFPIVRRLLSTFQLSRARWHILRYFISDFGSFCNIQKKLKYIQIRLALTCSQLTDSVIDRSK